MMMPRIVLSITILIALCADLRGQGAATFHVFPQIADGVLSDGLSAYGSVVFATNVSASSATCTLRFYGAGLAGRFATSTFTLPNAGSFASSSSAVIAAVGLGPLVTGYATMTCTQSVSATVAYVNAYTSGAGLIAGGTVFSSPPGTKSELLGFTGARLAFGLANDTDAVGQYQLTLLSASGQTLTTGSIQVAARSNTAKFIDEVLTAPANFGGALLVTSASPFSLVGLTFVGPVFFTGPATNLP